MRINVDALAKLGVSVRMYQRGKDHEELPLDIARGVIIELAVENGEPLSDELTSEIKGLIPSPAFAQATIEELYRQIHTLQITCRINDTEDK